MDRLLLRLRYAGARLAPRLVTDPLPLLLQPTSVVTEDCDPGYCVDVNLRTKRTRVCSEELAEVSRFDSSVIRYLDTLCFSYESSNKILPLTLLEQVDASLRRAEEKRKELVEAFVKAYPALCQESVKPLGKLYNPADYLSVQEVRSLFSIRWDYTAFTVPDKLKLISEKMWRDERDKISKRMEDTFTEVAKLCASECSNWSTASRNRSNHPRVARPENSRELRWRSCSSSCRPSSSVTSPMMLSWPRSLISSKALWMA